MNVILHGSTQSAVDIFYINHKLSFRCLNQPSGKRTNYNFIITQTSHFCNFIHCAGLSDGWLECMAELKYIGFCVFFFWWKLSTARILMGPNSLKVISACFPALYVHICEVSFLYLDLIRVREEQVSVNMPRLTFLHLYGSS